MRSLWFVEQGRVEWRDVPRPQLAGSVEALVEPVVSSTCDIDKFILQYPTPFKGPFAIGHNAVVRVIDVGDAVTTVKPGDLATLVWHISCGQCDRCLRGLPAHCRQTPAGACYGLPTGGIWGGFFDDVIRVPYADAMLHKLPPGIDPAELVAASDNLSLGSAFVTPHLKAGRDRILILGWGINGIYATAFAIGGGAKTVVYVDENPDNRATAAALGAIVADSIEKDMGPFDLVVDASIHPKWLHHHVLQVLEPEGVIECVAHILDVNIQGWSWYGRGATFHCGVCNAGQHVAEAFEAVSRHAVVPSKLWSERVAWDDDLPRAFAEHQRQLIAVRGT